MHQALALQHLDVANAGQVGVFLHALFHAVSLVGDNLVGLNRFTQLTQVSSDTQTSHTVGVLMLVLFQAVDGVHDKNQVDGFGERSVFGAFAGHIDDAFLETNDLTGGDNSGTSQSVGSAGADSGDFGDHAGENPALTLDLAAGLDYVLNRGNANALAGASDLNFAGFDVFVLQDDLLNGLFVYEQNAVLDFGFI